MYRTHAEGLATELIAELRQMTGRQPSHELSFKKLSDEHRHLVSRRIGQVSWLRSVTVVVCKDHIPDSLPDDNVRYLFALRFLLERISWLARSKSERASYTLAHIQRFKLSNLRQYEAILRSLDTQIAWGHLDAKGGRLAQPKELDALQLADLVASSHGIAFNPPANTLRVELAHLRNLRKIMYQPDGRQLTSYGLKMHPWNTSTKAAYPWVAAL